MLGIRHHGPGSARSLLAALREFGPDQVLIEGPADADPVIGWAASPVMRPPVAILAYAPDWSPGGRRSGRSRPSPRSGRR